MDYIRRNWLHSRVWKTDSWSVYKQSVRTNNDVEGWNHRIKKSSHNILITNVIRSTGPTFQHRLHTRLIRPMRTETLPDSPVAKTVGSAYMPKHIRHPHQPPRQRYSPAFFISWCPCCSRKPNSYQQFLDSFARRNSSATSENATDGCKAKSSTCGPSMQVTTFQRHNCSSRVAMCMHPPYQITE